MHTTMLTMRQTIRRRHSLRSIKSVSIGKLPTSNERPTDLLFSLINLNLPPGQASPHVSCPLALLFDRYFHILGIPQIRATIWSLLSDYIPLDQEIKEDTLARKREEYINQITHYFGDQSLETSVTELHSKVEDMSSYETTNFKQIKIDVYRTQPEVLLFSSQPI